MNTEAFNKLLDRRLQKIKEVLTGKAGEYSVNDDRLHNFKRAAQIENCSTRESLRGMAVKHFVNIDDAIVSGQPRSQAWIDEKIGDAVNYLILLEAVMTEDSSVSNEFDGKGNGKPLSASEILYGLGADREAVEHVKEAENDLVITRDLIAKSL